jgi:hypothetical protein
MKKYYLLLWGVMQNLSDNHLCGRNLTLKISDSYWRDHLCINVL